MTNAIPMRLEVLNRTKTAIEVACHPMKSDPDNVSDSVAVWFLRVFHDPHVLSFPDSWASGPVQQCMLIDADIRANHSRVGKVRVRTSRDVRLELEDSGVLPGGTNKSVDFLNTGVAFSAWENFSRCIS